MDVHKLYHSSVTIYSRLTQSTVFWTWCYTVTLTVYMFYLLIFFCVLTVAWIGYCSSQTSVIWWTNWSAVWYTRWMVLEQEVVRSANVISAAARARLHRLAYRRISLVRRRICHSKKCTTLPPTCPDCFTFYARHFYLADEENGKPVPIQLSDGFVWIGFQWPYVFFLNSLLRQLMGGSVAEWLACWTQAQKGPGSNRSRYAVE